ncbi:autotransporter domain-containing protein [Hyphomicrobium sp.]|uniref:autotransporter outer membrane beta-barrel domain-containing protein n=1 Tax=Hyphomicrobium sp. TaxID=82 RepID=UPI0025BB5385|nr:autotransporter domain-containing protein [Hyphomicrobium sp.]MCC7251932.1 autotransporter domain-containing protein [Hyphomicrobium sp.]
MPGVVNGGISVPAGISTLNVNSLTANIAPSSAGTAGILFDTTGDIIINSNTTPWAIMATGGGFNASGIFARTTAGTLTIDSTGNISSRDGLGIHAEVQGDGALKIESNGVLESDGEAIRATGQGNGDVTVLTTGDITSHGYFGIIAESDGTGKVVVESDGSITAAQSGITASSISGEVQVQNTGNVTAGGAYGLYGASDANVSITNNGNVQSQYIGIFAQSFAGETTVISTGDVTSLGGGVGSDPTGITAYSTTSANVTVLGGNVYGAIVGVNLSSFDPASVNMLTNYGSISGGVQAVRSGPGTETVDNYGVISGDVALTTGGESDVFNNKASAFFNSGEHVHANSVVNEGTLSPGGAGTVLTTELVGTLVQTNTGTFQVDIAGATADRTNVIGAASFAGLVLPNVISTTGSSGSAVIATSVLSLTSTATVNDTAAYDFSLSVLDGDKLLLEWQVISLLALLNDPLTPNQEATAIYLDALRQGGPSAALQALLDAVIGRPNEAAIRAALDRLNPEHYLAHVNGTLLSSLFFLNSALSCPKADGGPGLVAEGQCYWAKVGARTSDWNRTWQNIGGSEEAYNFSAGVQVALADSWRLGFAASYERSDTSTNNGASTDGDRAEAAIVVKNNWGATSFAAAAFAGRGWFSTKRDIGLAGLGVAVGDHDIAFGGLHTRLSHVLAQGRAYDGTWYVKPMLDLNATYLEYGDFNETGAGAANLSVRGESDWVFSASPALEIGGEWRGVDGSVTRPYVRIGGTFFNDTDFSLTSSFIAAPAGVTPFTVSSKFDDAHLDVSAGVDVLNVGGIDLKLNYDGRFAEDSETHSGGIKVGVKY